MSTNEKIPFLDLVTPAPGTRAGAHRRFSEGLRTAGFIGGPMVEEFRKRIRRVLRREILRWRGQRHRRGPFCFDGRRSAAGRHRRHRSAHIYRHDRSDQPGRRASGFRRYRRTDLFAWMSRSCRNISNANATWTARRASPIHRKIAAPVTAVVPVHIYGQCADMDPILEIARRYNLIVVEDACQAHGAEYFSKKENRWKKAGSMGHAAAFSFYPGKNLGACGEAGAVTTNSEEMARQMRMLRDHGQAKKYYHDIEGYNGRLDSLQAGLLSVKLRHLAEWNRQRQEAAAATISCCRRADGVVAPLRPSWSRPGASSVRGASGGSRRTAEAPGGSQDRHRHPLSDSSALAEGVRNFRFQER